MIRALGLFIFMMLYIVILYVNANEFDEVRKHLQTKHQETPPEYYIRMLKHDMMTTISKLVKPGDTHPWILNMDECYYDMDLSGTTSDLYYRSSYKKWLEDRGVKVIVIPTLADSCFRVHLITDCYETVLQQILY